MTRQRAVRIVAGLVGVWLVAFGLWAFFGPESFFEQIATFEPYNEHLIHDVGAFQAGLGAVLLAAIVLEDSLLATLSGVTVGFLLHFLAHVFDRDLGGRGTDPVFLGLLTLLVAMAALLRWADPSRPKVVRETTSEAESQTP